jgi:hypothetical protein
VPETPYKYQWEREPFWLPFSAPGPTFARSLARSLWPLLVVARFISLSLCDALLQLCIILFSLNLIWFCFVGKKFLCKFILFFPRWELLLFWLLLLLLLLFWGVCVCVFCEQSLEVFGLGTTLQQLLSALFA